MTGYADPIEQVRRAKARYCRFIDTKQWREFATLFIPEPEIRMFGPDGKQVAAFDSREAFVTATQAFLDGAWSSHHVQNDEIDLVSDDQIVAIWAMEDVIVNPAPQPGQPARMHGYGHYTEIWTLTPDGWHLSRLKLTRTILDINLG